MEYSIKSGSSWLFRITPIDFISYYPILLNQTVCVVRLGLRLGTDLAPTSTCWVLPWHGTKVPGPILKTNKHKKWYFHTSIWGSKKSLLGSTVEFFRVCSHLQGLAHLGFDFSPKHQGLHLKTMHLKGHKKHVVSIIHFCQVPTMDFVTFKRLYLAFVLWNPGCIGMPSYLPTIFVASVSKTQRPAFRKNQEYIGVEIPGE